MVVTFILDLYIFSTECGSRRQTFKLTSYSLTAEEITPVFIVWWGICRSPLLLKELIREIDDTGLLSKSLKKKIREDIEDLVINPSEILKRKSFEAMKKLEDTLFLLSFFRENFWGHHRISEHSVAYSSSIGKIGKFAVM